MIEIVQPARPRQPIVCRAVHYKNYEQVKYLANKIVDTAYFKKAKWKTMVLHVHHALATVLSAMETGVQCVAQGRFLTYKAIDVSCHVLKSFS